MAETIHNSPNMTSLTVEKKFGHSMPPYSPHTITAHVPGWQTMVGFRDGDKSILPLLKSMYPRFTPWGHCREVRRNCTSPARLLCDMLYSHVICPQSWS